MSPACLLLAVCVPPFMGLLLPDGPLAYYIGQSMLVALLLLDKRNPAAYFGIAVQVFAVGYAWFTEPAVVPQYALLALLVLLIASLEAVSWKKN